MNNYSEGNSNQPFIYEFEGLIYGCCFSNRPDKLRVAISSFKEENTNEVYIMDTNPISNHFVMKTKFNHKNIVSKMRFVENCENELIVTAGEKLRVWKYDETTNAVFFQCDLVNEQKYGGPISSFDSNLSQPQIIVSAQLDSSIAVWDIVNKKASAQFIAHEAEVLDVSFSQNSNVFASLGGDKDICKFDVRQLRKCNLISQGREYLKLSWNKDDGIYIAAIESDLGIIDLFDTRITKEAAIRLREHKDFITAIEWLPQLKQTLVSTGDDGKALCWDCSGGKGNEIGSDQYFDLGREISNLCVSQQKGVIGITSQNQFQILKVSE